MKIISKFHDYYDTVLVHGQDEDRVFNRNLNRISVIELKEDLSFLIPQIEESRYPHPTFATMRQPTFKPETHYFFRPFVIAFCGKLYHGIGIDKYQQEARVSDTVYLYSFEEYQTYCDNHKVFDKRDPQFLPYMQVHRTQYRSPPCASNLKDVQHWLKNQGNSAYFNKLIDERIAIGVCYDGVIEREEPWPQYRRAETYQVDINCSLKSFAFYRVLDAYATFQELEMYISGILSENENTMISINDKLLLQKKGFDSYSFKKRLDK